MSEQILLQGKLLGIEQFLSSNPATPEPAQEENVVARSRWVALVCEVIPRALLAECGLTRLLLGSSGGGQFLLELPDTFRPQADSFLHTAAARISAATRGLVTLTWTSTENLGDWAFIRKRLAFQSGTLPAAPDFVPFVPETAPETFFTPDLARELGAATHIGWSPDLPGVITTGPAKHSWSLSANLSLDGITIARHTATNDDTGAPATTTELAHRAAGSPAWGVLRGDVDLFGLRLRRLQSIKEHLEVSLLYKQFFAGELEVLCAHGEFWRKVTVLYSGGDDFAIFGAWDALILFARELQRTFDRFTVDHLKEFPGAEAKTITMAIAFAQPGDALAATFEQAGRNLDIAKAADKDCLYLFDRIVEWKQLSDAADLKETVSRVSEEFRAGRQFMTDLTRLYQKVSSSVDSTTDHERLLRRAYRFQRRYNRAAGSKREREFQKLRTHLIGEIVGRNVRPAAGKQIRLRPAGVIALEWARLSKEV